MKNAPRLIPALLGLFVLGVIGLLIGPGARAGEGLAPQQAPGTWVYDVRVVRVDPVESAVVETAASWQPSGSAGAITTTAWADLLAGLKGRGRTTILFDQRVTAISGVQTEFRQERKRPVMTLVSRSANSESWSSTYIETGTSGDLVSKSDALQYRIAVRWEEISSTDGTAPVGSTTWSGSRSNSASGETLVLSHRQQQQVAGAPSSKGLEIYVLITGWLVLAK